MKKIYLFLLITAAVGFTACKKNNYAEGTLSPIIAVVDLKSLYKGADVALTTAKLGGAKEVTGVVISRCSSGQCPRGYFGD
jgi:uncharacterized MnhB-related membrane protein